ncbi:MAG: AAA family ATPase [Cyclobacteriaceae bacterium]|nr:AAA family ATPase [Cyclobacteriaceae bacterium HetDA_MAG_MS6]
MNICISGELGSGKSSVSEALIKQLEGYEIISAGRINRESAEKKNLTTTEFNELLKADKQFDLWLDNQIRDYGQRGDQYIFDARLGWYFVPKSFKIHLLTRPEVAAERVFGDGSRLNEQYKKVEDALDEIYRRKEAERARFGDFYGVDINDFSNYNLIIDTSDNSIEEISDLVLKQFEEWQSERFRSRVFVAGKSLITSQRPDSNGSLATIPKVKYENRTFHLLTPVDSEIDQEGLVQVEVVKF